MAHFGTAVSLLAVSLIPVSPIAIILKNLTKFTVGTPTHFIKGRGIEFPKSSQQKGIQNFSIKIACLIFQEN